MMGKVNEAAGGSYDFPERGGGTIRAMAREIGGNAAAPLGRAAEGAEEGAAAAVGAVQDAASGAKRKVCVMCVLGWLIRFGVVF